MYIQYYPPTYLQNEKSPFECLIDIFEYVQTNLVIFCLAYVLLCALCSARWNE